MLGTFSPLMDYSTKRRTVAVNRCPGCTEARCLDHAWTTHANRLATLRSSFYHAEGDPHISFQGIFQSPLGIWTPSAVHVANAVSNVHAKTAFSQCLLVPQTIASATVPTPLKKKKAPILSKPLTGNIGANTYMWNTAISPNAANTPKLRAMTTGTPYLGRVYRKGL